MWGRDNHLHLHGRQDGDWITLLDLGSVLDTDLDDDTRHWGTNLAAISWISLNTADVLDGGLVVINGNLTDLSVHLEEDLTLTSLLGKRTDSQKLEDEGLALLDVDVELLVDLWLGQEVLGWENREITVLGDKVLVVSEDLWIHVVRSNITLRGIGVLGLQISLDLDEVDWSERLSWSLREKLTLATESLGAEWLWESTEWLTHQTLEEVQDGGWEIEGIGTLKNVLRRELVRDHELSQITNDLGGWRNLDDIAEEVVGFGVSLLGLSPLLTKTQLRSLEQKVGELSTWNFVDVDLWIWTSETGLEARVLKAELLPVRVDGSDVVDVESWVVLGTFQRGQKGTNGWLRGHTRHGVGGSVNGISTSGSASSHGSNTSTSRVVGMNVDWQVWVLLADSANQESGSSWLEDTGHILDTENVNAQSNNLIGKIQVVLKVVLLLWVQHITRVADGTLNDTTGLSDGIDTKSKLINVVQGVEDSEDIDTVALSLLTEMIDGVVGEGRVGNTVGTTEKHLEWNVWNQSSELAESVPWVFVQESHGNIESSTTPALQRVGVGVSMCGVLGDVYEIDSTDTSGQERLMGITPGSIHDESSLVGTDSLGKSSWSLLEENVSPSVGWWDVDINGVTLGVLEGWEDDLSLELWLSNLSFDAGAVDGNVSEVGKELLGSVLGSDHSEERWGIINESGPAVTGNEGIVGEEGGEEGNVGLDTANSELDEGTQHLATSDFVCGTVASTLDQHRIVMRSDNGTGETVTTIETDTVTTGGSVNLNLSGIWLEALCWIFGGDSALDGETSGGDSVLGQTKLLEGGTGGDLDLSGNDIDTGDFFGDGVLDLTERIVSKVFAGRLEVPLCLHSGVDLNKVVSVLLINQELGGTSVTVVDGLSEADSIVQDGLSDIGWEILCWSNLNDLLMTSLDRAISLVQVNDVAEVVTEELDLNMLWFVEESLDEDGSVTEGRLGP